jgi:3-phenylpropionate/cinnamic acid dioxygenase small subunit
MEADQLAITNQLARFARALDGRRWDDVPKIFAADVSFDYGEGECTGLEALLAQFRKYLDVCGPTQHLLGSIELRFEDAGAVTRTYVQARHIGAGEQAHLTFDSHGDYADRWEKRASGWLIVRRDVRWLMHVGDPAVLRFGGT